VKDLGRLAVGGEGDVAARPFPLVGGAGEELLHVTDNLCVRRHAGAAHYCCVKCSADLGVIDHNYKDGCVVEHEDVRASNPNIGEWQRYLDESPQFRKYYCPGCGALIENEIAMASDAVLRDIELRLP
jgi:acetone carboxylase gamma subunit